MSLIAVVAPGIAFAAQQQNPRGSSSSYRSATRSADAIGSAAIRRSATSVIARSTSVNNRKNRAVVTARPSAARNAAVSVRSVRPVITGANVARSASGVSVVRSAMKPKVFGANVSRAGVARATAVFNDVSKIGGGYSNCRDAYATCMDQLCANANDTYRRCFCSDRFTDFRDTADKLDEALKLLADFQDNNLNAVDKTAAEVNAMYTATAGEEAIKRDTSASQKLLDSIGDVLSGKKTSEQPKKQSSVSLGVLDFSSFSFNTDDVFGGGSGSVFGNSSGAETDVAALEGKELYDNAAKQCSEITREACGSDAMFNLAKSAYSIMITQDCNAYEKNINAKKASVEETVRTAEKYLREARLEEYRSHNSADVNECLTKVEEAIRKPVACGENYEKCMDYTGLYINSSTGEPIFSQALFKLNSLIVLDGKADVLGANSQFDKWLDDKKIFAETALDTCRDQADTVWYEFKRSAIIQIAQAQDAKIQQIKDSCVATVKQCYDKQTGDLVSMDTTETQGTVAIAAATARGMCYDRVQACAALYGDPDGCVYNDKDKKLTPAPAGSGKTCGLQSLLTFVDTVDSVKFAEGCESVLTKYAAELCPDETVTTDEAEGDEIVVKYGKCKDKSKNQVRAAMDVRMKTFCPKELVNEDGSRTIGDATAYNTDIMNSIVKEIYNAMGLAFTSGCEDEGGVWVGSEVLKSPETNQIQQSFYKKYYGTTITSKKQITELKLDENGWCMEQTDETTALSNGDIVGARCVAAGGTMDGKQCTLPESWYQDSCVDTLGGTWQADGCLLDNITK